MEKLFEIINLPSRGREEPKAIRIGIRISLAGHQGVCPMSEAFERVQDLAGQIGRWKEDLDRLLKEAERLLPKAGAAPGPTINADLPPEEVWGLLSGIPAEEHFVQGFNGLEEEKRKAVAEYVLTQCNIFSGRASLFSSRYNQNSALME